MMAVSKEILDLIPQGCKVNWNEKQQRFYVYKSTYYYSKEHKRSREQRTQVGTIVNGVFTYAKRQLPAFFYSLPRGSLKTATVA